MCPLCGHPHCSQTHIQCNCPGLAPERDGLAQDLALLVHRLRPGPTRSLGRAIHHLLFHHRDIEHRGQLWTGLWTPHHRALLSPHLRLCTLQEGQRTLLLLSTWATTGVTTLWSHFKEHIHDLKPLPTLPTTFPDTPKDYTEPPASAPDLYASDTPVLQARESPSPPPKRRRLARPPPEPPPLTPQPPPQAQAPMATLHHSRPRSPRSPGTLLADADHG